MTNWPLSLQQLLRSGVGVVRVCVAATRGSTPREPGASMLHWRHAQDGWRSLGSIGGGHLEAAAQAIAVNMLQDPSGPARRVQRFALGASLGQCCGGWVDVVWERFDAQDVQAPWLQSGQTNAGVWRAIALDGSDRELLGEPARERFLSNAGPQACQGDFAALLDRDGSCWFVEAIKTDLTPLCLYGAGHVARALVRVLDGLPFAIHWVDSREDVLAQAIALASPPSIGPILPGSDPGRQPPLACHSEEPSEAVVDLPLAAWHLVMTHSHDQDLRICEALLRRNDFARLGLIGSQTKARRFALLLASKGVSSQALDRLVTPIGISGITSKWPQAIAVSVAAQLLQWRDAEAKPMRGQVDAHARLAGEPMPAPEPPIQTEPVA